MGFFTRLKVLLLGEGLGMLTHQGPGNFTVGGIVGVELSTAEQTKKAYSYKDRQSIIR